MTFGQVVIQAVLKFVIANSFYLVVLFLLGVFGLEFYNRFYRINRDTDNVDLMDRWVRLQLYRRYYAKQRTDRTKGFRSKPVNN